MEDLGAPDGVPAADAIAPVKPDDLGAPHVAPAADTVACRTLDPATPHLAGRIHTSAAVVVPVGASPLTV